MVKKDDELPWVARSARWAVALCGEALLIGFTSRQLLTWFCKG